MKIYLELYPNTLENSAVVKYFLGFHYVSLIWPCQIFHVTLATHTSLHHPAPPVIDCRDHVSEWLLLIGSSTCVCIFLYTVGLFTIIYTSVNLLLKCYLKCFLDMDISAIMSNIIPQKYILTPPEFSGNESNFVWQNKVFATSRKSWLPELPCTN